MHDTPQNTLAPGDFRKNVRYELMLGRDAVAAIAACPVGYLPIGCLERHGDHLPMGLDTLKAHKACCVAAQVIGGIVFPAHFYAGIHAMSEEQLRHYSGEWGNLYTDATAQAHLLDIIRQIARTGVKALVLYTGHYPTCQQDLVRALAAEMNQGPGLRVIPFCEAFVLQGDHAGVSETSLLLYLDRELVDMTRIGAANYQDHGWTEANSPEQASAARGEQEVAKIVAHLHAQLAPYLQPQDD